ncbi:MAG: phosphonate transport system permease protein [Erysipelotrichaceae bacterium]|nr:MAG: phosphonate transport system permease [Erysipelotrichaceae bacterium]TXT19836.1 MAG: phosphonate transport system permease protein [Erysipelotrichaceae bacterium]
MKDTILLAYKKRPRTWIFNISIFLFLVLIFYASIPYIPYKGIQQNSISIAQSIIYGILQPDFSYFLDFSKGALPYLLLETIAIAFLGTLIGAVFALPFAFLSSRNIVPKWVAHIGTFFIAVIRTFPPFVYGLMFIRVTGPGPYTGVLTLAVSGIGMTAKLFTESIEDLDMGIIEGLDASGCNTIQKIRYGIIPQLMSNFVSTAIYRFEINVKNASILGLVGAGGIGYPILAAMGAYRWKDAGTLLFGLIVVILIIDYFSGRLRKKLATGL